MIAAESLRFETSPAWIDYLWGILGSQFVLGPLKWILPTALAAIALVCLLSLPVIDALQFTAAWAIVTAILVIATASFSAWRLVRAGQVMAPATYLLSSKTFAVESRVGRTQTDWSVWKQAVELGGVIVIRSRYGAFHTIPKRQLSTAVLHSLRELLTETLNGRVQFEPMRAS